MQSRLLWVLLGIACPIVLFYSVKRDIRFDKDYPADLRNRVVGSRIIKDGGSPYFYKWKKGDGIRYYDPDNFDTWRPSIMTSTPFLQQMLTPLVEMPQGRISAWWLVIEYLMLAAMVAYAMRLSETSGQRQMVAAFALLFLLTNAWERHTSCGQTYLCYPFFAMIFYGCWRKIRYPLWAAAAGLVAISLVLMRPNTLLFFVPFAFLLRGLPRRSLLAFFMPVLLLAGWTLADTHERSLWLDYKDMLSEQTRIHQGLDVPHQNNEPDPKFKKWEDIDYEKATQLTLTDPVTIYSENGNVFVIYEHLFHRKLPLAVLGFLEILALAGVIGLFARGRRSQPAPAPALIAIFGFCLYMISDLFSPVWRHQYYTVQWLFPLLLAATIFSRPQRTWYVLLLGALLLGCFHLPFLKMQNTIGEYGILAILLAISLRSSRRTETDPVPASV